MSEVEIKETNQDQCKNQVVKVDQEEVKEENPAEKELANCLKVQSDSDSESEADEKKPFVPKQLKTRADLIRKIKQSAEVLGNDAEVKSMRLHRRRRNSLDGILREQVARVVQTEAEKNLGIPQEEDKRREYAIQCLYKFDICAMKIVEKVVEYCNMGVTVDGLAQTIDTDSCMKEELKSALGDFIDEGDYDWIKTAASPTTRILLVHLYPLMSCLRKTEPVRKPPAIFPRMKQELATAGLRSVFRPPQKDSPPEVTGPPKLPVGIRLV